MHILDIPNELIVYIFNYVNIDDIIKLSSVCSNFYNIICSFEWDQILVVNTFNKIPKNISFANIFLDYPIVNLADIFNIPNITRVKNIIMNNFSAYETDTCDIIYNLHEIRFKNVIFHNICSESCSYFINMLPDNIIYYCTDSTNLSTSTVKLFEKNDCIKLFGNNFYTYFKNRLLIQNGYPYINFDHVNDRYVNDRYSNDELENIYDAPTEKPNNLMFIDNVVFVDAQYGTSSGVRGKETMPFQTLLQGLSATLSGDIIYVQPGLYETTTINLVDNVVWYFTDETTVTASPGYIFTDNNKPITTSINSNGTFRGRIICLLAVSTISLQAKLVIIE